MKTILLPPRSVFWVTLIGSDLIKICKEINAPKRVMDLRPKVFYFG